MTDMLEKVERAIGDVELEGAPVRLILTSDEIASVARAALLAMRDMPKEIQSEIFDARDGFVHEIDIPAVWTMGIDAILAERSE